MKEIIERLKRNREMWKYLTGKEQGAMQAIGWNNCEYLNFDSMSWSTTNDFRPDEIYRVKPDYKHKSGRWKTAPVVERSGGYYVMVPGGLETGIDLLPRLVGFGGVKYRHPAGPDTSFIMAPPNPLEDTGPWVPVSARFWVQE